MISETASTVIINFVLGLFFGAFPFFLLLRGFLPAFLNARLGAGKYLLRLHMPDGFTARWRVGKLIEGGGLVYKVGKEEYLATIHAGVVKRSLGVNWIDIEHGSTAPFNYKKLVVERQENADNDVVFNVAGFEGYDDSRSIITILRTALMQPRKGMALGNIDFKKVLIVGGIIVIAVYVVVQMKGGGSII